MNEIELLIVGEDNETHKLQCSQAFYGALLVMTGRYGTGKERQAALKADGFDAAQVQAAVNNIVEVI